MSDKTTMTLNAKGIIVLSNKPFGEFFPINIYTEMMDPEDGYCEFSFVNDETQEVIFRSAISFAPGIIVDDKLWADWFEHDIIRRNGEYIPTPTRQKKYGVNRITTRECVGNIVLRLHRDNDDILILIDDEKLLRRRKKHIKTTILEHKLQTPPNVKAYLYRDHVRVVETKRLTHGDTHTKYRGVFDLPIPLTDQEIVTHLLAGTDPDLTGLVKSNAREDIDPHLNVRIMDGLEYLTLSDNSYSVIFGIEVAVYYRLFSAILATRRCTDTQLSHAELNPAKGVPGLFKLLCDLNPA